MNWLWLLLPLILAVACFSVWRAFQSPTFWINATREVWRLLKPSLWKAVKPKDWTPEQRRQMDMGEEPTIHPRFPKRDGSGGS